VNKRWWPVLTAVGVVLLATGIFVVRDWSFFRMPNFMVEDATVLFSDVYTRNPIGAVLNAFNGYLIVGQYLLAYVAVGANLLIGGHLTSLPVVTALVACTSLGVAASLPFLLFRKELGVWLALALVAFTALVPMYSYDYAIIGSLSNLKFLFLYIAFMFILFRFKALKPWQYLIVDWLLLLCVLTDAPVAFLVPFVLLPYVRKWRDYLTLKLSRKYLPVYSGLALVVISALYVVATVVHGIPKMPGYMDAPFQAQSLLPVVDRSTFYAWLYPITSEINSYFVVGLLLIAGAGAVIIWKRLPRERVILAFAIWALVISTGLLVANRPGIGLYYLTYDHKGGPDQFFYAQNMIIIFVTGWLLRNYLQKLNLRGRSWIVAGAVVYLALAIPHGTSFGGSSIVYKDMRPIDYNLAKACREYADKPEVIIQIYPNTYWQWQVKKNIACK